MPEVLRDHVRFVFNRKEGKIEVVVLKEYGSVRMVPKPFAQIYSIANGQLEQILRQSVVVHHYVQYSTI
jgi:hypothetical protein